MASRNFEKRRTKERKARQAQQRRLDRLRKQAVNYEGVTAYGAARLSPEALMRLVASVKRRRVLMPIDGNPFAFATTDQAPKLFVRDGKPVPFEYL